MNHRACIGIGSNLADPAAMCRRAARMVCAHPDCRHERISSLYETEPWGRRDQPFFVNAVLMVQTRLSAMALLSALQDIERSLGRRLATAWGPRTADLDLLLYDQLCIDTPELVVPHPCLPARRFVLVPLVEIAPDLPHPAIGLTMRELLSRTPDTAGVRRLPEAP